MRHPLAALSWRKPILPALPKVLAARRSDTLLLAGLTLAGLALRLILLARFPLREDEALYGYWALHALHEDPRFLTVWPDKPPLFLWLLGGVFALLGPSAAAARWLGIAASTLAIPVAAAGARRLFGSRAAGLAGGLAYALNPFALSFASTVYTDPLLVLWGTLALVMALDGRAGWAGVWLGAAIMTKQQGLLYVPAVLALAVHSRQWSAGSREWGAEKRQSFRFLSLLPTPYPLLPTPYPLLLTLWRVLLGAALVMLPILLWDSTRWAVAPSPWDLATRTYAPLAVAPPAAWIPRLSAWGELVWYLAASYAVWMVAGLAWLAASVGAARRLSPAARIVFGWGIAYLVLHIITTVQVWDRYLLPLAPLWAWALAWPAARLGAVPRRGLGFLLLIGALCLVPPALAAANGRLPIGGDHGDYAGLEQAMAWVQTQPGRGVLYHQTLGWHARFYLYDRVRQGQIELRWFGSAASLADNAAKTPYPTPMLILPDWATPSDLPLHLAVRGLALKQELRAGKFTVYNLTHRPQPACGWCRSVPPAAPSWPLAAAPAGMSRP